MVAEVAGRVSQSWARRRCCMIQLSVRSTTHRRMTTEKPATWCTYAAGPVFDDLRTASIDFDDVVATLAAEGVETFQTSWKELLASVSEARKRAPATLDALGTRKHTGEIIKQIAEIDEAEIASPPFAASPDDDMCGHGSAGLRHFTSSRRLRMSVHPADFGRIDAGAAAVSVGESQHCSYMDVTPRTR